MEATSTLTTNSQRHTTGNDSADHAISVRQKGPIFWRVTDASSDVRLRLGWYPCMLNVRVTVADGQAINYKSGCFILDGLGLGAYQIG